MPALPYLVCLAEKNPLSADFGVQSARVLSMMEGAIRVFYSKLEGRIPTTPETLQVEVLRFHAVVDSVFRHIAVIPFRFPTILFDEEALREHCALRERQYVEDLRRLADFVQMEIHVSYPEYDTLKEKDGLLLKTGTTFLKDKQSRLQAIAAEIEQIRAQVTNVEWREKQTPAGVKAFALVPRHEVGNFRRQLKFSEASPMRLTGPWPATEFLQASLSSLTSK